MKTESLSRFISTNRRTEGNAWDVLQKDGTNSFNNPDVVSESFITFALMVEAEAVTATLIVTPYLHRLSPEKTAKLEM